MKKRSIIFMILSMVSITMFAQLSTGEVQILQDYFGAEKTILVKEYMNLTPQQDSAFWPIYKEYETARLELGKQRFSMIDEYIKNAQNITEEKASELVNESSKMEIAFKKLQKKYFKTFSKKIGAVKSAQFYQFENYLNNFINMTIQQNIPFVGQLEQKYSTPTKK